MKTAALCEPRLMAVLNITPDSFSDGGKYLKPAAAVERALQYVSEGATIIDMGAESSRPGSEGVPPDEQLRRLLPVLKAFRRRSNVAVSIDTRSSRVARACLAEGATIINDISALRHDRGMLKAMAQSSCSIVLMHMRGTPRTMQRRPRYKDVVGEVLQFFRERLKVCADAGIDPKRIWIDPGIGFGKTLEHNLAILNGLSAFKALGRPIVAGVSRKSFIGTLTGEQIPERRVLGSVVAGMLAFENGADILRVHDVAEHAGALKLLLAVRRAGNEPIP
ncbi:MAG TPA: dihydropteroate synthase [Planctomycetota bacterium]|nr:dihydropteroate synthase [Planctomycetota bacterium]